MKTKQIYNFKQLTKEFFYVNSNINEKNFPWPKEVSTEGYKVIPMNKSYSSQEALDSIKAEGCRPATIHELIVVANEHPELFPDGKWSSLVAFGTEFIDSDGDHRVPLVYRLSDGDRKFYLVHFEDVWGSGRCLLAFQEMNIIKLYLPYYRVRKMINKINRWICKKFGHKFDDVLLLMFEIESKSINKEAFKDETIQCERCGVLFKHKFNI